MKSLFLLFVFVGLASCVEISDFELAKEFVSFMKTYGRKYSTTEETVKRFKIFSDVYRYIEEFNRNSDDLKLGINEFADLTDEEFEVKFLSSKHSHTTTPPCDSIHQSITPQTEIDWISEGIVGPVRMQVDEDDGWFHAAVGVVESLHANQTKTYMEFSRTELMRCVFRGVNDKESFFPTLADGLSYIKRKGISNATNVVINCANPPQTRYHIGGCVAIEQGNSDQLKEALTYAPVAVSVKSFDIRFRYYKTGILDSYNATKSSLDHSMLLVGASDLGTKPYWIVQNSWGTSWGMNGIGYIAQSTGTGPSICGIAEEAYYPIL